MLREIFLQTKICRLVLHSLHHIEIRGLYRERVEIELDSNAVQRLLAFRSLWCLNLVPNL